MAVDEVLCMKGGSDESSYASNSLLQKTVIGKVRSLVEENIKVLCSNSSLDCLMVADLGCASGPNTLSVVQSIIDVVVSSCLSSGQRVPELNVFMNDLPQNDFNSVFKSFPSFYKKIEEEKGVEISCFVSGTPGSFYDRLFPSNHLHFMHCSYSLHWLSQVPEGLTGLNKGCIHACKESPPKVLQAYSSQFAKDFTAFLRCRSKEMVSGGRMVLALPATHETEVMGVMDAISKAFNKLASQGKIEQKKVDNFNMPYYRPTEEEVKGLIEGEESFALDKLEIFTLPWIALTRGTDQEVDLRKISRFALKTLRAVYESLFASEFGEEIIDDVFGLAQDLLTESLSTQSETMGIVNLVVSLVKKD